QPATRITVDPQDENVVYAVSWRQTGGLWRYRNGVWEKIAGDQYIAAATVHPMDSNIIAFVTNDHPYHDASYATGVYLTEDGGDSWRRQNVGLPMLRGDCIAFNPHHGEQIVVGTSGRGYYISGFDATAVKRRAEQTPASFQLLSNFPNPFNSQTTCRFLIDQPEKIEISVYNILGERVRMWNEQEYGAGLHRHSWDGRDDAGAAAAGGVYVVRLVSDQQSAAQKVVLIK
ncbi:MAG: T9SS C-terminal target domain-containing protein, partial [Calditrichaeota bacterium]